MAATFVIDVETGSTRKNLEAVTAAFEAGKISSKEYTAAVLAAAKEIGKFEAANSLAKMSLAQIGHNLDLASAKLRDYKSATYQAYQSLVLFHKEGAKFKTAFAGKEAVQLYNAELKKSISLNGQLIALGNQHYKEILKENAALQVQNAIKKKAVESDLILARGSAIQASSLGSDDKAQMMLAMGAASAFKAAKVEIDKTTGAIDKASGSTRSGSQAFTAYGSAIRGVAGSMGALWMSYGQVLPLMAAFGGAQAIKQVYSLGSQFEYTAEYVATLGKYAGQSVRSVGELREELLEVGDTRHNINELAGGVREFAKAGVDTATSLKDIGEMSRFASIAEMELVDATKLVIGQANAFGESYSDAANMISAAAMSSATDIGEMATAMSYTTELGSVAKVEFSEVAAAMGVLANNGIRGSKAGTSLRTSILRMQNPTKKLQGILKELNLDWSAFADGGKVKSIQAMFTELKRATDEMALTDQQMSELQYELFGFRSLKGGANLLKDITTGFVDMHESVTRSTEGVTFLQQATNDLADTATVKLDKVKKAFSDAFTGAFENDENVTQLLSGLKEFAESDGLIDFLSGTAKAVVDIGIAIQSVLSPLGLVIELGNEAGKVVYKLTSVDGGETSWLAKMGEDFWKNLNIMKKYEESVSSVKTLLESMPGGTGQAIEVPAIGTGIGIRSTGMSDPFAGNPLLQQMADIDAALDASVFGEMDILAKSDAIKEAAKEYTDATDKIAKARASLDDKLFSVRSSGGSAYEQYQYALEAANRQVEKLREQNAEIGTGPGMEGLIRETEAYGAALRSAAEEKFKLAESKAVAGLGKDIAEFLKDSAEPLTEYEQGLARIDAAVTGLRAAASEKAIELYGDDTPENLEKINRLLGGQIDQLNGVADAQKEAFSDRLVSEWQDKLSDLSKEYGQLSRHEEAVFAVTSKFAKEQEALNKTFKEGSPEAIRFGNALNQVQAYALATDTAILKTSDSIRGGLIAAIIDFNKEAATMGELSYDAFNNIADGLKSATSLTLSHVLFGNEGEKELKDSRRQQIVDLEEQFNRELELNKKRLDEGKVDYEEYQNEITKIHDKYEEDRYDAARQYQKDLQKVQKSAWEVFYESLKTSVKDSLVDSVSTYATNTVIGWGSSLLGGILGIDVASITGQAPTGASGSPFHVIVENWEGAGLLGGSFGGEDGMWWEEGAGAKTGVMGWISQYLGPEIAEAVKMVGGAVGLAGGAYGIYSGARDVSDGNFGSGALKMGTGAISAYKGAVSLGILEEGTATKIGTMIGEKVASWTGQKGVEIAADVATKTAAQTAAQTAATSSAALGGQGAAYAASSSVNAGTQLALAEGTYGASAGGGAAAGAGAYAGMFALPAMVAGMAIANAFADSAEQVRRDVFNEIGLSARDLVSGGVTEQLSLLGDSLSKDIAPALSDVTSASYDAGSGLLLLGQHTSEFVRTGSEGQGKLVESMRYMSLRWDEVAQAWKTVDNPLEGLVDKLHALAPATDAAAASAAQMLATQAGYPGLADELLTVYNDQKAGVMQLGDAHRTLQEALSGSSTRASHASGQMWSFVEAAGAVAAASNVASGAEERRRGILSGVAAAADTATARMNAQRGATEELASASGAAAGRISQAAGEIGGAVGQIGGILGRAATYSRDLSQMHADGAIFKYHAIGGVMTQPTVFHIGGEAGSEAILPLHRGPQTLEFIDKKIDALLRNSGGTDELKAVLLAVATYTKKTSDLLKRIEYVGIPVSKREAVG